MLPPLHSLDAARFDSPQIARQLITATRQLAELKGVAGSIPNQGILINSLVLQEAKDSSAIENIVTTHDELFASDTQSNESTSANIKEVTRYRQALHVGYQAVRKNGLLTNNIILNVHQALELNHSGFRKVPGTAIRNQTTGEVVHTPPSPELIPDLMGSLERFINDDSLSPMDPLIKMALIHHQFESIHPFYDGNGRTGRILNVLYLVKTNLLDIPVLYLSRHILRTRSEYYRLLQSVQRDDAWEQWVSYMLQAVELVARESIQSIQAMKKLMASHKRQMRERYGFYTQDLLNSLFMHPYTRIDHLIQDLKVSRPTATRYLETLVEDGFLIKVKKAQTNYYINQPLYAILTGEPFPDA